MSNEGNVVHAVLESRDESGYPNAHKAIALLKDEGVEWDPLVLWTAVGEVTQQNSRRRVRESERKLKNFQIVLLATVAFFVVLTFLEVIK